MTNYGSHQEQVTGGLPQSLVDAVGGGGGLAVSSGFVYAYTLPCNSTQGTFSAGGNGDITTNGTDNLVNMESWLDLSNVTQARLVGLFTFVAATGATLTLRYSTDGATFTDELTSPGFAFPLDALGWHDSGWLSIVPAARTSVYLRPFAAGNDGSNWASINPFYLQFK